MYPSIGPDMMLTRKVMIRKKKTVTGTSSSVKYTAVAASGDIFVQSLQFRVNSKE